MKSPSRFLGRSLVLATGLLVCRFAAADTIVSFGAVNRIANLTDLDLTGEMTNAINFSANDPVLTVGGVTFTPDSAPPAGATFVGPNNVTPWQTKPEFCSGSAGDTLEQVFEDIRWANNGNAETLEAHLPVTVGQTYRLQVLFYGNRPEDRKWDIEVEGALAVDEVTSLGASSGGIVPAYSPFAGVAYTTVLTPADDTLDVRFVGDLPGSNNDAAPDRNPIWQAITLEHTTADSDGDGMLDDWEILYFTNLSRNGAGDFDSDGLTDLDESLRDTKPNSADSDGDTLTDAVEVTTHFTSPKSADTDCDGLTDAVELATSNTNPQDADSDDDTLSDGAEVNTHLSDPNQLDGDLDSYEDAFEVAQGSNPASASSFPLFSPQKKPIRGADPGEGLDFHGTFLAAVRFGTAGQVDEYPVGDANFVPFDLFPSLTQNAANTADNWLTPTFGTSPDATADDMNLALAVDSIRYGAPVVDITVPGLTAGKAYKVQLLTGEQCCNNRGFDVFIENVLVADEYITGPIQGGASTTPARIGAVVAAFIAQDTTLDLRLDFTTITTPGIIDSNTIINALTVEELPPLPDTDTDGLPDIWEITNFGSTSQLPTGDPDADGLNNLGEFQSTTNPNDPDSDDDGLNDGPEVNTHLTDPRKADTDGDGLNDGAEVTTHLTNPKDADSDNDEYSDGFENSRGTNPNSASSYSLFSPQAKGFSGGDVGEGLDLDGTFIAAVRFGTSGQAGSWPVRDATFVPFDTLAGLSKDTTTDADNWLLPSFATAPGATTNDLNLGEAVDSISYGAFLVNVTLPGLTIGKSYKVQVLFGEACCNNRGFDVYLEDTLVANEFAPGPAQGGASGAPARAGAVVAAFVATDDTLDLRLDFTTISTPGLTDFNAIINALTVEELAPVVDTDGDGLPDAWEQDNFGGLTQTGAGDADSDGLNNAGEYLRGLKPNDPDSDDDGLNDGPEVLTSHSDPWRQDTDGDGLSDGTEVNAHLTDPTKSDTDVDCLSDGAEITRTANPLSADSDSDGVSDGLEVFVSLTDPKDPASKPSEVLSGLVCGGDEGEGLDLKGDFVYAFNVGPNGGAGQIQDADFTADDAPGITVTASDSIANFANFHFGITQNDNRLEKVMNSIRYQLNGAVTVDLADIEPGARYKLQLLFGEGCCDGRGEDIIVEDLTVIDNFITGPRQGGQGNGVRGSVVAYEFVASETELNIRCDGPAADAPSIIDHNAILSGVTLERLTTGGEFAITQVTKVGTSITLNFKGTPSKSYAVDFSTGLTTWAEVTDAANTAANGAGSFVDTAPARTGGPLGYYRVRDPILQPAP